MVRPVSPVTKGGRGTRDLTATDMEHPPCVQLLLHTFQGPTLTWLYLPPQPIPVFTHTSLIDNKPVASSGPLHMLSPLSGTFFPKYPHSLLLTSPRALLQRPCSESLSITLPCFISWNCLSIISFIRAKPLCLTSPVSRQCLAHGRHSISVC